MKKKELSTGKTDKKNEINVYSVDGKIKKRMKLSELFNEPLRIDLIMKAVKSSRANRRQRYGSSKESGKRHAVHSVGKGFGMSRVPRLQDRTGSFAPGTVGGRRAHPPKSEKKWKEKMNKKEKRKAVRSAIAATSSKEIVIKRGHVFNEKITLPVVVEDDFENMKTTKEVINVFQSIGVYDDILRAKNNCHIRAGKGKGRGRKYRIPKSVLVVVSKKRGIEKSVNNLLGVDIVTLKGLNAELLAPGGAPGRLTVFSESAFKEVGKIE
ncbi:MAG: 50S ribosomal protein L4 [Thermoplasmatales archaeon]|nr:50S ribosomal protein L4 [Thermoplasmatales archaeon]